MGLAPRRGLLGRLRDVLLWPLIMRFYDRVRPALNDLRRQAGAPALAHVADTATRARRVLAYSAEPFEYPRAWPIPGRSGTAFSTSPATTAPRADSSG
jgi:hypothetical protein